MEIICIDDNSKITNINHMTKLKELVAQGSCGINDEGINNLNNIEILYVGDNSKITNINHMTKLKELDAQGTCGISDEGIISLNNLEKNMRGL